MKTNQINILTGQNDAMVRPSLEIGNDLSQKSKILDKVGGGDFAGDIIIMLQQNYFFFYEEESVPKWTSKRYHLEEAVQKNSIRWHLLQQPG